MVKQFSVFLENNPGRLANLMDVFEKNRVKLLAIGIAEAGNYGIARIIVDDEEMALKAMHNSNMAVNQTDVVIIDLVNLAPAVKSLSCLNINIEYAYTMDSGKVVLKVSDEQGTTKAFADKGIKAYPKC